MRKMCHKIRTQFTHSFFNDDEIENKLKHVIVVREKGFSETNRILLHSHSVVVVVDFLVEKGH